MGFWFVLTMRAAVDGRGACQSCANKMAGEERCPSWVNPHGTVLASATLVGLLDL